MGRVALIIIYNYRYDANIEKLEWLYQGKFSHIYHLIPFYDGPRKNVISVYDHSFCFQGYVAQGLKGFFQKEYNHYFFVADDMVLNPSITEGNYEEHLHLDAETSFLPEFITLHDLTHPWPHVRKAFEYRTSQPGVNGEKELPDPEVALQRFRQFGLDIQPMTFEQVYGRPILSQTGEGFITFLRWIRKRLKFGSRLSLSYPLVGSYSDIFVVSANAIQAFCRYCGIFSATRLFVELAVPTALVLSAKKIVTEKSLELKGRALWTAKQREILSPYGNQIQRLIADFPPGILYLHPIKTSKWSIECP